MKIEGVTCIWMFVYAMIFELPEMAQKWSFGFFRPNLPQLGLFHPYFVSKSSFRVISMIKMIILEESKPIKFNESSTIFKSSTIRKFNNIWKLKNPKLKIHKLHVYHS